MRINNKMIYVPAGAMMLAFNKTSCRLRSGSDDVIIFNTAEKTDNLGDQIIMRYCSQYLRQVFQGCHFVGYSTHVCPPKEAEKRIRRAKYRFVCGTNLLTSHIEQHWNWTLPAGFIGKWPYRNSILFGTGWHSYQDACSDYTKLIYRELLHPGFLHSVRDSYSEEKLRAAGFQNVLNTGCPTMWALTPEFCSRIPAEKAEQVVTTLTDYRRDPVADRAMLKSLLRSYDRVFLWLQGRQDLQYLQELDVPGRIEIIPRELSAYEALLDAGNIDYVGTRLHAGIFALNHKVRSLIVAVDNRALEIAKDTSLPICPRDNVPEALEAQMNSSMRNEIRIPTENIQRFLAQFT